MVLARAALEKKEKEEIISLHVESHDKLSETITQLTNQVSELAKILSRMENQQASCNSLDTVLDKKVTNLKSQCWKNSHYSRCKCIEIVGISDDANEKKACEFLTLPTGALLNLDSLEAYHHLPSEGKNKIIVKFSKRKDVDLVMRNRHKLKQTKPSDINIPNRVKLI